MAHIAYPTHTKTLSIPNTDLHYSYVHIPPSTSNSPTLLFLHGFPSSPYDFRHQITYFSGKGYGILAPDLLGYGGTSSPHDPAAYTGRLLAQSLVALLDHEKLQQVHAIGHDFGCVAVSKLLTWAPARVASAAFLAVPYGEPGARFDLEAANGMLEQALGFQKLGYMRFMVKEEAPGLLSEHNESLGSILYSHSDDDVINFYAPDKLEAWLRADKRIPVPSTYVSTEELAVRNRIFAENDYVGPTNWYRVLVGNLSVEEEEKALEKGEISKDIHCPVLGIDESPGRFVLPGFIEMGTKPWCKSGLEVKVVSTSGHWVMIESKDEVNKFLEEFLPKVAA